MVINFDQKQPVKVPETGAKKAVKLDEVVVQESLPLDVPVTKGSINTSELTEAVTPKVKRDPEIRKKNDEIRSLKAEIENRDEYVSLITAENDSLRKTARAYKDAEARVHNLYYAFVEKITSSLTELNTVLQLHQEIEKLKTSGGIE